MPENDTSLLARLDAGADIDLYLFQTRKFKSVMIKTYMTGGLDEHLEQRAILPFILKMGSENYPSLGDISRSLERLYGAGLAMDIFKLGERHIFMTVLDMVHERFIPGGGGLILEGTAVLRDVLTRPRSADNSFIADLFDSEKRNLERLIRSQINDKAAYANIRLVQEMFKEQPFGRYQWGDPAKVAALDPTASFTYYRCFLESAPTEVFIVGDISPKNAVVLARNLFDGVERKPSDQVPSQTAPAAGDGAVVVEEQPLEQSKLAMGFNVGNDCDDALYYAFFFYNAILGGGSYSKLFKTVREKESLAYYVHSAYDKLKGFLRVSAGIHRDSLSRVTDIIGSQMDDIAAGRITDEEYSNARKSLLSGLLAVQDSPGQLIDYSKTALLTGRETRIEKIADNIRSVRPDHIAAAAALVSPGKTFFLKGTAG